VGGLGIAKFKYPERAEIAQLLAAGR